MTPGTPRLSLLWKILLSTSVAITVLFAATGWIVLDHATRSMSESAGQEVQASFRAYQSLWRARAERLASVSSILSAMSDVRAAFGTADEATIRDTAAEMWARISDENAVFLVADPRGRVIASLGGESRDAWPEDLDIVRQASAKFPEQATGFVLRGRRLYHMTVTPVFVQSTGGPALLNALVAGYEVSDATAGRLKEDTGGSEFLFIAGDRVEASTIPAAAAAETAAALRAGDGRRIRAGGVEYVPLVTTLNDVSGAPLGRLAILRSFEGARARIASLQRNVALLWLASVAAGLLLTYVLARRIIEPVKMLDRAAAEVAKQNYDCAVAVKSDDELGRLAHTFNSMCASLREAREDLVRTERIATIGRLATSIVHDLRNPLAAIYGGSEMLMEAELPRMHQERLARNMYRASRTIQQLLDHLLDVCRGKREERAGWPLEPVASSAAASLAAAAEARRVQVVVEVPPDLEAPLERSRIERVFLNLIANAVEAMPDGGIVRVSAAPEDGSVVVRVRDTGPGVPAEIRGKLFQPFVTAGKKNGLGLGLALARQAVLDHGGDMWVENCPNGGACFAFRLPRG
jgi:signal transduction histidine kinase